MGSLGELGVADGVGAALLHTSHLVVGEGEELIVGHWYHLGLELGELEGLVAVLQGLHLDRVGLVVDEHGRVGAHIDHVYHVVVHDAALVWHAVEP